jgi:hypothetical protein
MVFSVDEPGQCLTETINQLVAVFCDKVLEPFAFHDQPQPFDGIEIWGVRWKKKWFKISPADGLTFVPCSVIQDKKVPLALQRDVSFSIIQKGLEYFGIRMPEDQRIEFPRSPTYGASDAHS